MLGAIIGDIAGSIYEWGHCPPEPDAVDLLPACGGFTDDSVMTVAVASALLGYPHTDELGRAALVTSMQQWAQAVPVQQGGYGRAFSRWLDSHSPLPYGSFGNGAVMRVSAAGWLYPTRERTEHWAAVTAMVSHNHAQGVRGAQAVASAIYLARQGAHRQDILDYVGRTYGYRLDVPLDQAVDPTLPVMSCQATVPEALVCFAHSTSFDHAVRLAVSLGGDTDTRGAVTGSIAEAYYGIDPQLAAHARSRITWAMREVLDEVDRRAA